MTQALEIARQTLLDTPGLAERDLTRIMDQLLRTDIDAADLYFQRSRLESWVLDDGIIKEGSHSIEQGAGLRAISGEKTGFAYTDDLHVPDLLKAADAARSIARAGQAGSIAVTRQRPARPLYPAINPLDSLAENDKIELLRRADAEARAQDPRVQQVTCSLVAAHDVVLVTTSDGELVGDVRPLVRMNVQVIVEHNGRREQGSAGAGARQALDYFLEGDRGVKLAREAVRQALVNLEAVDAPAGLLPVVLGPGWPGVLLHEAVGHGLEGDFNRKGTSAFAGRMGERVASPLCTVVDDGTLVNRRGSLSVDDEGTESQYTVLIENGVLKGYMQDRMTNTYMLAGAHDPREIIASVDRGLYAVNFGGGQVDITSGKFVFSASEAYLIENGSITQPVKGATLIGNGPDVLTKVSMVGNDLELDAGIGTCGKEGQSVPVGVGQPTLKIDELTVGGTQAG